MASSNEIPFTGGMPIGPNIGFAAALMQEIEAQEEPRSKHSPVKYPWPEMEIVRPIDMQRAGSEWRNFSAALTTKVGDGGETVSVRDLQCTLVSSEEMATLMAATFPKESRSRDPSDRRRVAKDVAAKLKGHIADSARDQIEIENTVGLAEDDDLRFRAMGLGTDFGQRQLDVSDQWPAAVWTPVELPLKSRPETVGRNVLALVINDHQAVIKQGRQGVLEILGTKLGFNVTEIKKTEKEPLIEIAETNPQAPLRRMKITLPSFPSDIPLKAPKVRLTDQR